MKRKKKKRIKWTLQWTKNTKVKAFKCKTQNQWVTWQSCIFIGMERVPWKLFHMTVHLLSCTWRANVLKYRELLCREVKLSMQPLSRLLILASWSLTIFPHSFLFVVNTEVTPLSCPSKLLNRISNLSRRSVTAVWPSPSGVFLVRSSLAEIVDCGRAGVCPANERNFLYWRTESRRKRRRTEMVSESSEYPIQYSHVGSPTAWKVSKATFTSHYFYY